MAVLLVVIGRGGALHLTHVEVLTMTSKPSRGGCFAQTWRFLTYKAHDPNDRRYTVKWS